jgi:phosphomethylpyrimidine synthase
MTIIHDIRGGKIPDAVKTAACAEHVGADALAASLAVGKAAVLYSPNHPHGRPIAVGGGTRIKVNANIGTSTDNASIETELEKLDAAVRAGADTVMDLSTGPDIRATRKAIIKHSPIPVGTVPIYEAAKMLTEKGKPFVNMTADDLFEVIERHGEDGVAFITVHCGVTRRAAEILKESGRLLGVVSRGGAFTLKWMECNALENPLYEQFGRLLEIAKTFDMTLSLGDGIRPGCLADATDRPQIEELVTLGELQKRALAAGVQCMIEGPGHVPLHQIAANIELQKSLCGGAPFYVLGPLVTDIAAGHDHIAGAIGGALAAWHGADFLCYVTPSEHLRLPGPEDVFEGVIASRIAAHAADIARGIPGARDIDDRMSRARKSLDWKTQIECALDPAKAKEFRESAPPSESDTCTMCGKFCAIKVQKPD